MTSPAILAAISPIVDAMLKDGPVEVYFRPGTGEPSGLSIGGEKLEVGPAWLAISAAPNTPNGVYVVTTETGENRVLPPEFDPLSLKQAQEDWKPAALRIRPVSE